MNNEVQLLNIKNDSISLDNSTFLERLNKIFFHPDHFQVLHTPLNRQVMLPSLIRYPFGRGQHLAQLDREALEEALKAGVGFRLLNASLYFPDLSEGVFFDNSQAPFSVNLYYSTSTEPSLPTHSDNTDIVVIQSFGSKKWVFGQKDIVLNEGDILFIPKGQKHKVLSQSAPSLHFSISIFNESLRDKILENWANPLLDKSPGDVSLDDLKILLSDKK